MIGGQALVRWLTSMAFGKTLPNRVFVGGAALAASLMFYLGEGQLLQPARQSPIPIQRDGMPSGKVGGLGSASDADLTRKSVVVCVGIVSSLTENGTATVFSGGNRTPLTLSSRRSTWIDTLKAPTPQHLQPKSTTPRTSTLRIGTCLLGNAEYSF